MRKPTVRGRNIPEHLKPNPGAPVMFDNAVLERLSKISPITVLVLYIPVSLWLIWQAINISPASMVSGLIIGGFLFWTLFEYVFHRTVFHFWPKGKFQSWLQFVIHGVHHKYPHDKQRLVMPVTVSATLAWLLFLLFRWTLGDAGFAFTAGFVIGYLFYDMMHYSIHHFETPKNKFGQLIWRHHLAHHFLDACNGYGVSTPFWDYAFGTTIPTHGKTASDMTVKSE